jgi:hypothetical protein
VAAAAPRWSELQSTLLTGRNRGRYAAKDVNHYIPKLKASGKYTGIVAGFKIMAVPPLNTKALVASREPIR